MQEVFRETASGAKTDRSQLRRALDQLDAGDVLMVTRLDRLRAPPTYHICRRLTIYIALLRLRAGQGRADLLVRL